MTHEDSLDRLARRVRAGRHPERGMIPPAEFIPVAEESGMILSIGEWVLKRGCHDALSLPDDTYVAINLSAMQFMASDLVELVRSALDSAGLPPHRLELEVTESIFLRDADHARAVLEQVMALGCPIALDDFGTGYSSLGYLRKLRFSTIKIDRTFVQGAATNNPESLAIVRAVVAMADSLGMSTTAEGVETEKELEVIRQLGCKKIQGFFFGRPMEAEEALKLFRASRQQDSNAA